VKVPIGASGSSQIKTNDLVPLGALSQDNCGDIFAPSQVYLAGIIPPSLNESLFTIIFVDISDLFLH
jgi:hypothetical protein